MDRASARAEIEKLVGFFEKNRAHYESSDFDEAKVRVEFIDPLFQALGWDVRNEAHRVGRERDVIIEDRTRVRGHQRRPDYGFRVDGALKFFVEAKRPSQAFGDADAAFQVKSCAWSAGAPLGVLMDFSHLRGFDGSIRPEKSAPDAGRLSRLDLVANDYVTRFDDLYDSLSREAVRDGNLDRLLQQERRAHRGGKGRASIARPMDAVFLDDLERWRQELATELARRNTFESSEDLASATQLILDRILFLRVCEDREIEPGARLRNTLLEVRADRRKALYPALVKLFRQLAPQYNGTLFKPHFSEQLHIEKEGALVDIIEGLYDPAPYRFDFVPVELLGAVYERFLGSTITIKGGRAKVEQKPDVRHAGGVYYTPRFIVDAIVEKTIGPMLAGKTPEEMLAVRVLDPACGSGGFLLAAFQLFVERHEAFYRKVVAKPGKHKDSFIVRDGVPRLTLRKKQDILTHCIFGVDLDAQAVEVAQMSLYLKLLEGEREDTISPQLDLRATYLPPLFENIRRGNSLVSSQDLDPQQDWTGATKDVHPFDWWSPSEGFGKVMDTGGFDGVIGNPPYIRIQEMQKWAPREVEIYKRKFASAKKGNFDAYVLFVEQALAVVKETGRVGLILPHKFFQAKYGEPLRELLAKRKAVEEVVDFGHAQVFEGATTYTCLLFLNGSAVEEVLVRRVSDDEDLAGSLAKALGAHAERVPSTQLTGETWDFGLARGGLARLSVGATPLGDLGRIFVGLQTSADDIFHFHDARVVRRGVVSVLSKAAGERTEIESDILHPLLSGRNVKRHAPPATDTLVLFPYQVVEGQASLIDEKTLKGTYPLALAYLRRHKAFLEAREHGKFAGSEWYRFRPQNLGVQSLPKLCIASLVSRPQVTVDADGAFFLDNVDVCALAFTPFSRASASYLLALVNSTLLAAYFRGIGLKFRGGFYRCNKQALERFPIRLLDVTKPDEKAEHDALVALAERMMDLKRRRAAKGADEEALERAIEATDREIDDRVYRLYGVTDEERRRIEEDLGVTASPAPVEADPESVERLRAKVRATFGEWGGPVPSFEGVKEARREAWAGYVEEDDKRDD